MFFFQWDQKITTLPGLYLASIAVLSPLNLFTEQFCTIWHLRYINVIFNTSNVALVMGIIRKLFHQNSKKYDQNSQVCCIV